ncbi:S1C family serine protease [Corynebacterium pseudopelargi]|uniref:Periplasmic pH-dependent serine endoprotease DegQ n=1 Tax=Corynebacterium pseudopelargi TaxID=2080757 RepID=A0A3G6IVQ9_9CORY|nr:trypsin-like peptidase domain-containing protein [Corynebacterium pseudopelargi]AZA09673.1 Periplasmic pH-dependent serine endoprotease DegQ precursor [Corynebacterium pseudopelargi]
MTDPNEPTRGSNNEPMNHPTSDPFAQRSTEETSKLERVQSPYGQHNQHSHAAQQAQPQHAQQAQPQHTQPAQPQASQHGDAASGWRQAEHPTQHYAAGNAQGHKDAGTYPSANGQGEHGADNGQQWAATPVAVQPRERKRVSLATAIAMTLVGAIAAGSVTGVYAYRSQQPETASSAIEAFNQPVSDTTGEPPAEGSVEAVAAKVLPSVVSIQVVGRSGGDEGSGSIISSDGYILTNNHVVSAAANGAARMAVVLNDGRQFEADFVAGDPNTDVAVIKLRGAEGLPTISFGDSSQLAVGQQVVAIGSPLGLSATVTTGIVSAVNRPVRASGATTGQSSLIDAIQTDAAINPGNSGGPLVDMQGNLIGMNSMIASLSNTQETTAGSIGLGFAIPSNFARRVAQQLIDNGEATQPMIGVEVAANANVRGALVAEVQPDGPGDRAGIKRGDVIIRVGDRSIDSADALVAAVRSNDFGQTVKVQLVDQDGSNPREVEVTLTNE